MKKKIIPVLIVIGLILVIAAGLVLSSLIKKYTPTKEREDLSEYYHITSEDQIAIVLNQERIDSFGIFIDEHIYLDYRFVHDSINERFYWDSNENILFYSTASDLITIPADSTSYLVTRSSVEFGRPIVKATSDSALIDIEFVKQYSDFVYTYYEDPSRIVVTNDKDAVEMTTFKKNTSIRVLGGIKSPILSDVKKNDPIIILTEDTDWTKVMTEDGIIGYVRTKTLSKKRTSEIYESEYVPETFNHIKKDYEICMAWHQVTNTAANSEITNILSDTKGINIIAPTWFYLNDNNGNLMDLASSSYVNYCHQNNIEVWATVNNLDNPEVDSTYVLTHTSTRQNLVNQIVSVAIQYNLDGINLDLEALDGNAVEDAYIQLVRELSYKCHNNGLVLSVDNYVPMSYTAFYNRKEQSYFADYVVIMGYDEHYSGSEEAGSVASFNWVKEGVENTLKEVPADQVILGMPFYTRVWSYTPSTSESDTEITYDLASRAYGMRAANNLINDYNAEKVWLDDCGQYYAEFEDNDGVLYKVWLEDTTSAEKRLALVDSYSLAGAAFWKLGFETDDIWDIVIKYIN